MKVYFHQEVIFLRNFFQNNGYTSQLFDKLLNIFLANKYQPKQLVPTVNKEIIYLTLPFLGDVSRKIQNTLKYNFSKFYPQIDFRFVNVNSFRTSSFFNFKDRMPSDLRSSVIYKFTCPSCQAGYFGSTFRAFKNRTDEHIGQSSRTGRWLQSPPHSAVREHAELCDFILKKEHFEIIDTCHNNNLRLLESLYIKVNKPQLNNMLSAAPHSIV